jgi:hypothetical protein
VIFIIRAKDTYSHCRPPFCELGGQRSPSLQASRWHYTVADKCNSLVLLGEGMDEPFVTTATTVTTALPEAPFFLSERQSARRAKKSRTYSCPGLFAERPRFELGKPFGSLHAFQACLLSHSSISPVTSESRSKRRRDCKYRNNP